MTDYFFMDNSNNNKRIAIFCHDDPLAQLGSQESGGQAVYVNSLIKELDKKGWAVDAYTRLDSPHKKSLSMIGKRSRLIRLKGGPSKYIVRKLLFDFLPELYENFLNCIDHQNPYLLFHGHYWDGGWLAMKAHQQFSKPFIENFHSLGKIRFQIRQKYAVNGNEKDIFDKRFLIEEEIIKEANLIISLSESEKIFLQEHYNTPLEKVIVIPGGVNLKIFFPMPLAKVREKLSLNSNDFILLFVGRLEWRKGIGTLIHAANILRQDIPGIKVLIIGGKIYGRQKNVDDFREYQRLLKTVNDLKLNDIVHFLGSVDHDRLPLYYSAANIFVVPSYYEPFGLVVLESMACKIPVVASEVGGLTMTIQNNVNGLLVKPRSPVDLKEKILRLYREPALAKDLAENGYKFVKEKYSWETIIESIHKIYLSFINNQKIL